MDGIAHHLLNQLNRRNKIRRNVAVAAGTENYLNVVPCRLCRNIKTKIFFHTCISCGKTVTPIRSYVVDERNRNSKKLRTKTKKSM